MVLGSGKHVKKQAVVRLASVVESSHAASKSSTRSNRAPAPMPWETELKATKEAITQTILKEDAKLRHELQDREPSLASMKKEIDFYNKHSATKDVPEKRLKDYSNELSRSPVFASLLQSLYASEQKYETARESPYHMTDR